MRARDTLYYARLFHECDVELCGDPTDNGSVISRETRRGWIGVRCAPEVIAGIGEEIGFRLVEVR